jgi:hypothetical protein
MRLIDADALLKVPNVRKVEEYDETGEFISYLAVPVEAIEEAPTPQNVIVLPCNIGDTIYEAYFMKDSTGSHICEYICSGIHIADKVSRWQYEKPVRYLILKTYEGHSIRVGMDELGKTLFLTEDEAKAALQKGRKEHAAD